MQSAKSYLKKKKNSISTLFLFTLSPYTFIKATARNFFFFLCIFAAIEMHKGCWFVIHYNLHRTYATIEQWLCVI